LLLGSWGTVPGVHRAVCVFLRGSPVHVHGGLYSSVHRPPVLSDVCCPFMQHPRNLGPPLCRPGSCVLHRRPLLSHPIPHRGALYPPNYAFADRIPRPGAKWRTQLRSDGIPDRDPRYAADRGADTGAHPEPNPCSCR